jgi:hypothetical protein
MQGRTALLGTCDAPPVALLRRVAGLGAVAPDRDVFLGNIEDSPLVVGDTTFDLRADMEGAREFGVELAIRIRHELPLLDVTVFRGCERIQLAVSGTAIEATAEGRQPPGFFVRLLVAEHGQHRTSGRQRAVGRIDPPRGQPHTCTPHACHGDVARLASHLDAVAHVDVVRLQSRAQDGPAVAVEAIDFDAVLLGGAEDQTSLGVRRVQPDRGVLDLVIRMHGGIGGRHGRHLDDLRRTCGSAWAESIAAMAHATTKVLCS